MAYVFKFAKGALRLRYLFLGSAVGGSVSLSRKYDEWRSSLPEVPDLSQLSNLIPSIGSFDFEEFARGLSERSREKLAILNQWVDEAKNAQNLSFDSDSNGKSQTPTRTLIGELKAFGSSGGSNGGKSNEQLQQELRNKEAETIKRNEELIRARKELERLKKENRELRTIIRSSAAGIPPKRKLKKTLIEMYSEVLDELSNYDSSYKIQDHLPKVVVVGDQSSGKTSVLEMIAGARIFPRGAGEMMTRSPVQVILSEGPYHVARFNDSQREFDLTREDELKELRKQVEERMKKSAFESGKTVSNQVISLTIQGPGLQRMVLVDLPGIIGTNTSDLAPDTRESIRSMVTEYMGNPNAIILCIQDGALDAERSIVTDLVRSIDTKGRRTILVLTKVDLAEKAKLANPAKIKKILDGELYPIKAIGYYAVVAGRGQGNDESIQSIKDYEEQFFLTSQLCTNGILDPTQCTTRNLSAKVSECFWSMVRASVEQQADTYKATLYNLEADWYNSFPSKRQLVRDELFALAKNEILNQVVCLSQKSTQYWDTLLAQELWRAIQNTVFQQIYLPASQDSHKFNAKIDVELKRWVESQELARLSIDVAKRTISEEFQKSLMSSNSPEDKQKRSSNEDSSLDDLRLFEKLKLEVILEALKRHDWKPQALDVLKVVQNEALAKQTTLTKDNWDKSITFLNERLQDHLKSSCSLDKLCGPTWFDRWFKWKSSTRDQTINSYIQNQLKLLMDYKSSNETNMISSTDYKNNDKMTNPGYELTTNDLETIKQNLHKQFKLDVSDRQIRQVWKHYKMYNFIEREIQKAKECSNAYYLYENGVETDVDCNHVILFWRIQRLLEFTASSLRRQLIENECKRIEREIIDVLEEFGEDEEKKRKLLTGKRVELAEELSRVRRIQEKIDEFIAALNQEA